MSTPTLTLADLPTIVRDNIGQRLDRTRPDAQIVEDISDIAQAHLLELRDSGVLKPIVVRSAERNGVAETWNTFVQGGEYANHLKRTITVSVARSLEMFALEAVDPRITEATADDVVSHLDAEIRTGFPILEMNKDYLQHPSTFDRKTGENVLVTFSGWVPAFWGDDAEGNRVRVEMNENDPLLLHFTLPAHEPIWCVSMRKGPDIVSEALYSGHVDKMNVHDLNSDEGAAAHSRATHEKMGVMAVTLRDYFPRPITDIQTGTVYFPCYGDVVEHNEVEETKAEAREDWDAGHFVVADPRFDMSNETSLDTFSIAAQSDLLTFVSEESGKSPADVLAALEADIASRYPEIVKIPAFPAEVHVYIPYGAAVESAAQAIRDAGHYPFTGGRECGMIISQTPLEFPTGVVEELGVLSPAQRAAQGDPKP